MKYTTQHILILEKLLNNLNEKNSCNIMCTYCPIDEHCNKNFTLNKQIKEYITNLLLKEKLKLIIE